MFRNFNTSVSPKNTFSKILYIPVSSHVHFYITKAVWLAYLHNLTAFFSNLLYFIFLKASLSHVEAAMLLHPDLWQ